MFKDAKIIGAAGLFLLFFIVAAVIAYVSPAMRAQFESFVFMGLGAMYSIVLIFVKPDGGNAKVPPSVDSPDPRGSLSQPSTT